MATIPIPTSTQQDIYDVGFDRTLNRNLVLRGITTEPLSNTLVSGSDFNSEFGVSTSVAGVIAALVINKNGGFIRSGQTGYDAGTGFWLGDDAGTSKFSIGDSTANKLTWDGSTLAITGTLTATVGTIGGFDIGTDYIRDVANSMGLASTVTGGDDVRFWAGDTFANRATADFRVTEAGALTATSVTLSTSVAISGIANNTSTDISLLERTHDLVFSVTDADTIAWAAGTINLSNGRTFSIVAGNTGNMTALTYIYLDTGVSSTVLQTTTTYSTAVGANKVLIGTAQNNTVTASFIPFGGGQQLVDGAQIGALSIVAGNIAASTITAGKMSVSQLSAIAADLGSITAGSVSVINGTNTIGLTPSGTNAIFSGTTGSPEFKVTPAGALTATSATITGSVTINTLSFNKQFVSTSFESFDGWTKSASNVNAGLGGANLQTSNVSGTKTNANDEVSGPSVVDFDNKNPVFECQAAVSSITNQTVYFGVGDLNIGDGTEQGFGFKIVNGTLSALSTKTVGGVAETLTTITGITLTNINTYRAEMVTSTDTITYYVNGVLKATHTSTDNIPSSTSLVLMSFSIKNSAAENKILYLPRAFFYQD